MQQLVLSPVGSLSLLLLSKAQPLFHLRKYNKQLNFVLESSISIENIVKSRGFIGTSEILLIQLYMVRKIQTISRPWTTEHQDTIEVAIVSFFFFFLIYLNRVMFEALSKDSLRPRAKPLSPRCSQFPRKCSAPVVITQMAP